MHKFSKEFDKVSHQGDSQQQNPSPTGSTERRKYYGGQPEKDWRSTNFNVSRGAGSQEASSKGMGVHGSPEQDSKKEEQEDSD
ncbi:unnamed protein product [Schistosoma curassoni]|uniref:HABP4_PAI-RBP1 domain-containing protein n=1 Tax=Schistosoma curassoni TaxID=6186 RepID=A0A183K6K0_9TREM|nr:unnamed protein product [Schistosoma curassoni]